MNEAIREFLTVIRVNHGINDKARLAKLVFEKCNLTRDGALYYCNDFAVRFSESKKKSTANTVCGLSKIQKYDDRPVIVCVTSQPQNRCVLANTTFLKRVSHSSHKLRVNNIRGSINFSDIVSEFEGIANDPSNFDRLFNIHAAIGFEGNLARLVEATNNISPTGVKFVVDAGTRTNVLNAPRRAMSFVQSPNHQTLKQELDEKVNRYKNEILLAALIEPPKVRGMIIEYLIAGEDDQLRQELVAALIARNRGKIPHLRLENDLGDYHRSFPAFDTETDVKTKVLILSSNPKAYNLDKMLEYLSRDRSVFLFYFVGVDPGRIVNTVLVSMFQQTLLNATILLKHWSGRNSRGVSQFEGHTINQLIERPEQTIDEAQSIAFLERVIAL